MENKSVLTCLLISEILYFISKAGFKVSVVAAAEQPHPADIYPYRRYSEITLYLKLVSYKFMVLFCFILFSFHFGLFYFNLFYFIPFHFILFIFTPDSFFLKFSNSFHFNLFLHRIHFLFKFPNFLFSKIVITLSLSKKSQHQSF